MIPIIKSQSDAIITLKTGLERVQNWVIESFLYSAITQIFRNDLTLSFFSAEDLPKVVSSVIQQGNLTFNAKLGQIPLDQIVTKLLVRQQIDFVPRLEYKSYDPQEIGRRVITSCFAIPRRQQTSFLTYKLQAIPFLHKNQTIQLAEIPRYWAINPKDNTTMEWHDPQESGCDLQLMTSCRDTPPVLTLSEETCLGQIIGNLPLSSCHTTAVHPFPFFLRQLRDNFWIVSSPKELHCLRIPTTEYYTNRQQTWNLNEQLVLPLVTVVNVSPGYTIACPGFTLTGRPIVSNATSLTILYNNSRLLTDNIAIVDVYKHLKENTTWFNTKPGEQRMEGLMKRIREPLTLPDIPIYQLKQTWWSFGLSFMSGGSWILLGVVVIAIYFVLRCKKNIILQKL